LAKNNKHRLPIGYPSEKRGGKFSYTCTYITMSVNQVEGNTIYISSQKYFNSTMQFRDSECDTKLTTLPETYARSV
jgi:hypothetical protein